ncbi:hypothetical protein AMAG_16852 [Allomyces macrogynus ATCC 38327]|uniref:Uncharacterized protein n=1 Tax=Allomyces macrogynus (strain ATCC 38327) TaxID=578462 RepID=A0A0L0T031_ALLM3|nr:hypothetical protein GGF32_003928 [Allomyces javanicus]KAJ3370228.1 hypothetical protein GGF31_004286 [Allomyces arbusculus]KNE68121.1 hypothetical protein AMAG_13291 [Allomyces macrogynus ATCC 38327]KNE72369.1 hypothetical protein AMAG_16852 [Allomyces macrogynus ATCC 38327]|eukprot:KNE68121.1 hypothetical protein AMAG_13291 [Allomyces macrogynus ATCC 38327]
MALLDSFVNRPNKVVELQKFYQSPSARFIYAKSPKDRFWLTVYGTASAAGLVYCLYGLVGMTVGHGKKPGF